MRQVHSQVLTLAFCRSRSGSRFGNQSLLEIWFKRFRSQLLARSGIKEAAARGSVAAARASRAAGGWLRRMRSGGGGVLLGQGFACCLSCG
ncbi:hypothetical protein F2Q70_00016607 [Brassica cretica]|uniref:Uncharacterized protein n=1 Tax=Brassica cretica TaxID=69181 RepID=A0A8S9HSK5_BRACR|nr:hypothetical protein F2Q70_00016607 [Brassica cretica]KAF2599403.1 hypothetical protein F2Q68_00009572 [Brassica cretica]